MVCAIEDAGFVIHPMLAWIFATGFPKASRLQCEGTEGLRYGLQSLKPAIEPICMAQKPMIGTGTQNWQRYGTGAINVDATRIRSSDPPMGWDNPRGGIWTTDSDATGKLVPNAMGRWPSNCLHDGSPEVEAAFAAFGERNNAPHGPGGIGKGDRLGSRWPLTSGVYRHTGSASRFFFSAKADIGRPRERAGIRRLRPLSLLEYLGETT